MKVGETVSVVTMSGEYVGKLKSLEPLTLEDPRMIIQTGDGKMGFAKGIAVTGVIDPKEQIFNQYVFVCKTNDDVSEGHSSAVSGIVTEKPKIVTT